MAQSREVLIAEKEKKIEEKQKSIQEDRGIADDENEYQDIRERARERIKENQEQIDAFENGQKNLKQGPH